MRKLHAHEIAAMSREQVLHTLATAAGVPESSRRMAEITLGGPTITPEEADRLRGAPMRYNRMFAAVALAFA